MEARSGAPSFGMTHGSGNVGVAADNAGSIRDGLTLGWRWTGPAPANPSSLSAEAQHGGLKGEAGPGAGLIK